MKFNLLIALALMFALSACATQTFKVSGSPRGMPKMEESQSFFVWGIGQEKVTRAKRVCGRRGVRAVQTKLTFVDGLLTVLTAGLYSPRTAKVCCK